MLNSNLILSYLSSLYGASTASVLQNELEKKIQKHRSDHAEIKVDRQPLSEKDIILITYGDQITAEDKLPLIALNEFCSRYLSDFISSIHLLPFYPYSSDDGFAVIDYRQVNPALGTWDDIMMLHQKFRLMFDGVINHISSQSRWFQDFLSGNPDYQNYFIVYPDDQSHKLQKVVRPRTSPLLSEYKTSNGSQWVWTTFSRDQIDLNYQNPQVLLEMIDLLLFYVKNGADFIRLDAIAYLWKKNKTSSINLPETHCLIKLFRAILNEIAPQVKLITETNIPHKKNIAYFGDGTDEADLVYNFALPPLLLHTFFTGDAVTLSRWADSLNLPSGQVTFFNYLASHDGIGLNPVRGILSDLAIDQIIQQVQDHGGLVSYKQTPDGKQVPYELNINYFDALSSPRSGELLNLQVDRFIAAHAVMLSLVGLPGLYFHSLFGSRSWNDGVWITGSNRSINRQKFKLDELEDELADPNQIRQMVFNRIKALIKARSSSPAFNPYGNQKVIYLNPSVFALLRSTVNHKIQVFYLQNVTNHNVESSLDLLRIFQLKQTNAFFLDLISRHHYLIKDNGMLQLKLAPYQSVWLQNNPADYD